MCDTSGTKGMKRKSTKNICNQRSKARENVRMWLRRRDGLLSRIVRELSLLSPEARRQALQSFSQPQRVALEQWMLRHRCQRTLVRRCRVKKKTQALRIKSSRRSEGLAKGSKMKGVVSGSTPTQRYFYAVACLGMLRFTSRKSHDLWTAVSYRKELLRLVQRVRSLWGSMEERMLCAVTEALPFMKALDLRLAVRFRLGRWVAQPLSTPTFVATNQVSLRCALYAWRRLHRAREALRATERAGPPSLREERSWLALRNTLLDVEAEAGMPRDVREVRLARAEQSRASHRQKLLERWNRQQMAHEDRLGKAERKRERDFFLRGSQLLARLAQAEQGLTKARASHLAESDEQRLTAKFCL
ncbi:unnamed protein product [Durusdinium trenchii]|uniref:Uncharacterized protein n=2 Tax=Durusdinium trenchii TaxID=1381693 RepID=A0ABP0JKN6_9DINO